MSSSRSEIVLYLRRFGEFTREDWLVYVLWVGTMVGLAAITFAFVWAGSQHGAPLPASAWLVPTGALTFTGAIAVDTVGHRTVYKEALARAEGFVHRVTIFCGVTSCVLLCAAYAHRVLFVPATVLTVLSFVYSLVDEAFHWHRYWSRKSDVVEMWSHLFILLGHGTMMAAWWMWCWEGYAGVPETLRALGLGG